MEYFGDEQEQVSISIDENEAPILDSEDDSFSSSVFDDFETFKTIGLTRIHKRSNCYQVMSSCVASQGMGNEMHVAAIHYIPRAGPNGRLEDFRVSTAEMVEKRGGNGNVKLAWYGGSRDEICRIVSHGFQRCRQSDSGDDGYGVYLYPLNFVMDGFVSSLEDENGIRHILLCSVILGNMEEVRPGSRQFKPSSNEFDSGVDDLSKPTRFIIWEAYMNSHIFPSYVVSFRALNNRGCGDPILKHMPTSPCVEFSVLIPKLANVLPPSKMELLHKYQSEFRRKRITRAQLVYRLRQLAGDELLNDVINFYTDLDKLLEGRSSRSSALADPK